MALPAGCIGALLTTAMTVLQAELRRINLIQTLLEDAQSAGYDVQELPDNASKTWSEARIREFFAAAYMLQVKPAATSVSKGACQATTRLHSNLCHCPFSAPPHADFDRWFPGTKRAVSGMPNCQYRFRVLCFHSAGSAEDMFTSEGTGNRKATSPLLEWCRAAGAECLAVQLPGRAMRSAEPFLTSAQQLATELLPIVASRLQDTPYAVIGHSLGAWLAYDFLCHARSAGLAMPLQVFLSAMPDPSIPEDQRPWQQQHKLQERQFQEECRCWNINELVFSPALWPVYHKILRADFSLFDQYKFQHAGEKPFDFPLHTFHGTEDSRITAQMVQGWAEFTTGAFTETAVDGNHLWPFDKAAKAQWLQCVADKLQWTLQ